MRESTKQLYSFLYQEHQRIRLQLIAWAESEKENYNAFELADSAYALREMLKMIESLQKELKKQEQMAHAKAWVIHTGSAAEDDKLVTQYCTATVQTVMIPSDPKKSRNEERYFAFMDFLQIPREIAEYDMIRLQWPNFMEWFAKRMKDGKPHPPGFNVNETHTTGKLSIRKKKNIEYTQ